MKFIRLTNFDGSQVYINFDYVTCFYPSEGKENLTCIEIQNSDFIFEVEETTFKIFGLLQGK